MGLKPCFICGEPPRVTNMPSCGGCVSLCIVNHCNCSVSAPTSEQAIEKWNNCWAHKRLSVIEELLRHDAGDNESTKYDDRGEYARSLLETFFTEEAVNGTSD